MSLEINADVADSGSGSSVQEDPNAQRKAEILAEISDLQGKIDILNGYKEVIATEQVALSSEVTEPIIEPYDLQEENKWRGAQYDEAVNKVTTIGGNLAAFDASASAVCSGIQTAIDELNDKITDLWNEYNSL